MKGCPFRADTEPMTQPQPRSLSWEVRLAAALVGVGALLGGALMALGVRLLQAEPGFLFAILPLIATGALCAGLYLAVASVFLVLGLLRRARAARVRTALLGSVLAVTGLMGLGMMPWLGFGVAVYGGALVWLMLMPGAEQDLGPWSRPFQQPAPWGGTPGRGLWSAQAPQQGPWAPDPTALPWMSWKGHSGPRAPWWQTWQAGLAQGIPLWEALVLGVLLLVFLAALVAVLAGELALGVVGVGVALAGVVPLEQRMRQRLAGRR